MLTGYTAGPQYQPLGPIQLTATTGVPHVDAAFLKELQILHETLGVVPTLFFNQDLGDKNVRVTRLGQVAFGLGLLVDELDKDNWDFIAFALAHECGHILQYLRQTVLTRLQSELHADLVGGYYIGRVSGKYGLVDQGSSSRIVKDVFDRGDYETWHFDHHGTPGQRMAAFMTGLKARDMPIDRLYDHGVLQVLLNMGNWLDTDWCRLHLYGG